MKKSVKILLIIGIIWLVAIAGYFIFFCEVYFTPPINVCRSEILDANSGACPVADAEKGCYSLESFLPGFFILGIPSWILFVITFILSKKK